MNLIETTIGRQFKYLVEKKEQQTALVYIDREYSWQEINHMSEVIAYSLLNLNVAKGSKIGIWAKNSPTYISTFLAVVRIGCTAVLINPAYKTFEMNQLVDYADLTGVFCDSSTVRNVESVKGMQFLRYMDDDISQGIMQKEKLLMSEKERLWQREEDVNPYDEACMLFTSGTTGGPKGVPLTHVQLLNVALRAKDCMHWDKDDVVCVSLPMFHSFGLSTGLLAALFHEGKICLISGYHSEDVINCIEHNRCTVLNGVPTMFLSILNNPNRCNRDLSTLKSGIIAGSGVCKRDFLLVTKELDMPHLMQSYGQTEASPSITFSRYEDSIEKRSDNVGVAIPDCEMRIVDSKTGIPVPSGQKGIIEIRGFNTMRGYYKNSVATEKTLHKDGWLDTGDIGYMDDEGYLYVIGREKEMIIRGGENIAPKEIEDVIVSMPGIHQVKILGIKEAVIQESIAACIVSDVDYSREDIRIYVRKSLADYKAPKYVLFFKHFPETENGKIDIKVLRTEVEERIKAGEEKKE